MLFNLVVLNVPKIPDFPYRLYPLSKIRSPTLQLKVCPGKGHGNGTAVGRTRGGTIRRQGRSSGITPVSVTAPGNNVTPSPPVLVDPPPLGSARRLLSSDRSAALRTCLTVQTRFLVIVYWSVCVYCSYSMAALCLKLAPPLCPLVQPHPAVVAGSCRRRR